MTRLPQSRPFLIAALASACCCGVVSPGVAGEAAADWEQVVALDAGPRMQARTQAEARQMAMGHLDQQERAVRGFLSAHPDDPHAFEAKLRLARLLQIRADFEKSEKARAEAKRWLDDATASATPEQRPQADFANVTFLMRSMRASTEVDRERLLTAVKGFQKAHPDDRRLPALLAEVATLFDAQPRQKRALLTDAQSLTQDEELKRRIADDLKRLDLLGQPISLSFTSIQGPPIDLAEQRGRAVVLVFFADWSPPSIAALAKVKQAVEKLPADRVRVLAVSLDQKPEDAARVLKEQGVNWPTGCDGKAWGSPLARSLGINTLPTVWIVDPQGRLCSINATDTLGSQLRQVLSAAK